MRAEFFKLRTTQHPPGVRRRPAAEHRRHDRCRVRQRALAAQTIDQYVSLETHGHGGQIPPEFLNHLKTDWALGHSAITQAATIYTAR